MLMNLSLLHNRKILTNNNVKEILGVLNSLTQYQVRNAAVQSLGTYTISMCNKLALKESQLCHLIASHSVLSSLHTKQPMKKITLYITDTLQP